MTMPIAAPHRGARIEWMDFLRGLAVTLVVLDHSIAFARGEGAQVPPGLDLLSDALNPVRMPLMVFLSGLLLPASLAKGTRAYVAGKLGNVLHPLAVWTLVYVTIWNLAEPVTGSPHDWGEALGLVWDPPIHLWFLRDLLAFYLLAWLLARTFGNGPRWPVALAALFASAALGILSGEPADGSQVRRALFLFAFFLLGAEVASRPGGLGRLVGDPRLGTAAAILAVGLVPVAALVGNVRYEFASVPLALGAILALSAAARAVGGGPAARPVRFLGRHSLVVFVSHWLFVSFASGAVGKLLPEAGGGTVLALVFACGLAGAVATVHAIEILGLSWLVSSPWSRRRHAAAAPGTLGPAPDPAVRLR
jgi:peptidoglycan/LPS O-acetylase OafA/YrhL